MAEMRLGKTVRVVLRLDVVDNGNVYTAVQVETVRRVVCETNRIAVSRRVDELAGWANMPIHYGVVERENCEIVGGALRGSAIE